MSSHFSVPRWSNQRGKKIHKVTKSFFFSAPSVLSFSSRRRWFTLSARRTALPMGPLVFSISRSITKESIIE